MKRFIQRFMYAWHYAYETEKWKKFKTVYAIDPASPDGDYAGLTIRSGKDVYSYTGKEAQAIADLINNDQREDEL